jgi:hypothetical protein
VPATPRFVVERLLRIECTIQIGAQYRNRQVYIDFCAQYGVPYHSLDGVNDLACWTHRACEGTDITRGIEGLDLKEVIAYAQRKGREAATLDALGSGEKHGLSFPLYHAWGSKA